MKRNDFLQQVWTIAHNTYREIIRQKLLYGVMLMAALLTAASFFLSSISLGQNSRIMQNIGLSTIHLFCAFIMIFLTANSVAKDFERRALYLLFPKPITRAQYVLGKYFGLVLILGTTLAALSGLYILGLVFTDASIIPAALANIAYSFLEISLVISFVQLFASFTSPINANLYGIALYIIGHSLTFMRDFVANEGTTITKFLIGTCYYLLPNLEKFNIRAASLYSIAIPASQIFWSIFYGILYIALALFLTTVVVRNQEV